MNLIKSIMVFGLVPIFAIQACAQSDQKEKEGQVKPRSKQPVVAVGDGQNAGQTETDEQPIEMSDEAKADIVKLITINNELKTRLLYLLNSFQQLKARTPGVKPEFWAKCQDMFHKDKLSAKLAPVYAKHYTPEEVKELIKFFESPIGKKYVEKSFLISRELNVETNQFGTDVGDSIRKNLDEAGYAR